MPAEKLTQVPIWYCAGPGCTAWYVGSIPQAKCAGWQVGCGDSLCKRCVGRVPAEERSGG